MIQKKRLVIVGAGAAGFFCAVNTARMNPQLDVVIVEKTNKLLSKVKVSGGGRCNVTHACFDMGEMIKNYPRGANFLKKAFHQFFTTDTIQWFKERNVTLVSEADGRMFPETNTSQTIIDCLLKEANRYGVTIMTSTEVLAISHRSINEQDREKQPHTPGINDFVLQLSASKALVEYKNKHQGINPDLKVGLQNTAGYETLQADYICIASGGYPKLSMFEWIEKTSHSIENPVPSLFTFNMPGNPITSLMGVSVEKVRVKVIGSKLESEGPLLITHWGFSGPATLKLSAWGAKELAEKKYVFTVTVNWIPQYNDNSLRENFQEFRFNMASQKMINRNPFGLPQRLWEYLMQQSVVNHDLRWADLPGSAQNKLIKNLLAQEFKIGGKTTFKEEFVTAGGVKLSEIDANTMMSKKHSGLFFAGEIMDVDGVTGGFNFQHAWTSGWIAAKCIASQA